VVALVLSPAVLLHCLIDDDKANIVGDGVSWAVGGNDFHYDAIAIKALFLLLWGASRQATKRTYSQLTETIHKSANQSILI